MKNSRWRVVAAAGLMVLTCHPATAQSPLAYQRWLAAVSARRAQVSKFEGFLRGTHVDGILPTDQLLLSATSWRACRADSPYSLPPQTLWPHIVGTLAFIRARVVPAIGRVNAVSGYRSPELGKCAGGAPKSAHGDYYALDLVPVRSMDRTAMIGTLCALHRRYGQRYAIGLGFYEGMRFHVDTKGTRLWGTNYHAATSPCLIGQDSRAATSGGSKR